MSTKRKTVMMIDDDSINNIIMEGIITKINEIEAFLIFTSAWEALAHLSKTTSNHFPDVIFVDLKMPEMDGFEFVEQFEKKFSQFPQSKIYIVSSSVSSRDKTRSTSFKSVSNFIIKPLTKEKILEIISS